MYSLWVTEVSGLREGDCLRSLSKLEVCLNKTLFYWVRSWSHSRLSLRRSRANMVFCRNTVSVMRTVGSGQDRH